MKDITEKEAFQKLSALCARGEHCQHDMLEKMRQWGMDEEEQARVMQRLVAGRFVDDERYARAFIHDKIEYNQWGRRKVEQALWQKHIDAGLSKSLLDEVDDDTYVGILKPLLRQKQRTVTGRSDYERSMKLIKWAVGRGFTMDIIRQCLDVSDEDEFLD
jgi:regulatory protein